MSQKMMTLRKHGLHKFILVVLVFFVISMCFFTETLNYSKITKKVEYNTSTDFQIYLKQKIPQNTILTASPNQRYFVY